MEINLSFDIAALFLFIVIISVSHLQYLRTDKNNHYFNIFAIAGLLLTIFDLISLSKISMPDTVRLIANTGYYLFEAICIYCFIEYICSYFYKEGKSLRLRIACIIPLAVYLVCIAINIVCPIIIKVSDNTIEYGKLHFIVFATPVYFYILAILLLYKKRKSFPLKIKISTLTFIVFITAALVIQAFIPNIMLSSYATALSTLIVLFTLETPDYRRLMEAMKELERTKDEATRASTAKSTFLANMSHEIRTPINGVLGMNEIILKSNPPEDIKECSLNIENSGRSLLALVNDILDLSKIESGMMELVTVSFDSASMIKEINLMMEYRAKSKGLEYKVIISESFPSILYGDEIRIRQIAVNLLTNAIKYTEQGTITFKLDFDKTDDDKGILTLSVKDTGHGIKEESMDYIFDAFKRVGDDQSKKIEGTGLGLKITKQFVTLMDGKIDVKSKVNEGSEFTVTIPLGIIDETPVKFDKEAKDNKAKEIDEVAYNFEGLKILTVDDTLVNLKVIKGLLKKTGIEADTASSGIEALKLMETTKYDLILMDHMMPDMDGIETFHIAKERGFISETLPVIVLTANAIQGAREEYMKEGFTDYLTKPLKGKDIYEAITKYCNRAG